MNIKNTLLTHIYNSLENEPEKWTFEKYTAEKDNIEIWMCNRYYHTKFNVGSIEYGGMCMLWVLKPWQWWRVKLIKAVERAQFKVEFEND